jgi:hypothetical protein
VLDANQVANAARRGNALTEPVRVMFGWSLTEPDVRLSGRGVLRMAPPYRARLDLFTGSGEGVVSAALVDDGMRLPPGVAAEFLPPPALFWAAVGVFRPGATALVVDAKGDPDSEIQLRYRPPGGGELHFRLEGNVLTGVELLRGGQVVERVEADPDVEGGFPRETVYRHMGEFRELKFELESVDRVEDYPEGIWTPGT